MEGNRLFFVHVPVRMYKFNKHKKKPVKMKNVILVRRVFQAPRPSTVHVPQSTVHVSR